MTKQLLIAKDVAAEVAGTVSTAQGKISNGTNVAGVYQLNALRADGSLNVLPEFSAADVESVELASASAGTSQVITITPGASLAADGDAYSVKVIITTPGTANLVTKTFEYVKGADGAGSVENMVDAFAAAINASDLPVAATEDNSVLTLTFDKNEHGRAAVGGAGLASEIAYTAAWAPSVGQIADLKALGDECAAYAGVTNKVGFPVVAPAYEATAACDIAYINIAKKYADKSGMVGQIVERFQLIVAIPDGGSNIGIGTGVATTDGTAIEIFDKDTTTAGVVTTGLLYGLI